MTAITVHHRTYGFDFPAKTEPSWSQKVDRWYQLDAYAYGLSQATAVWAKELKVPSLILLASPGASNETDWRFVQTGASSPSKFVHTLPNVRASALCQVIDWHGPVLCIQRDPRTLEVAMEEGKELACPERPVIWVITVFPTDLRLESNAGKYEVHHFEIQYGSDLEVRAS